MVGNQLLSNDELRCLKLLGEASRLLRRITFNDDYPNDWHEAAHQVHNLQNMVMSQAAARAYPDRFRLMGSPLRFGDNSSLELTTWDKHGGMGAAGL